MGMETAPTPVQPAELTVQDRIAQLHEQGLTREINTGMNQLVGHEKQADEARERVTPLWAANDAVSIATELDQHANGDLTELSEGAQAALAAGETATSLLDKAEESFSLFRERKQSQEAGLDFDERLDEARTDYVNLLVKQPKLPGRRKAHREKLATAEQTYNEAVINKIQRVMQLPDSNPKAPYAPPVMRELTKENPDVRELAGNRLHVLVDQLAREQLTKSRMIENLSSRNAKRVMNALSTSRPLRAIVAGVVFAGAAATMHKGLLPEKAEHYVEGVKYALELLPAYLTVRESTLAASEGLGRLKHRRQMKRDMAVLAKDTLLADLALRTVYSNVEYQDGNIPARSAGDESKNGQAFQAIDDQFAKLEREGYRGGKPYSAEQVMPYIADLYVRRKEQIDGIVESADPHAAFIALCHEVITADTQHMTRQNQASVAKKTASRAFALAGAVFATKWVNQVSYMREMKGAALAVPEVESA